ncbi:hypothetical protein [Legionella sp. WA2022007384]
MKRTGHQQHAHQQTHQHTHPSTTQPQTVVVVTTPAHGMNPYGFMHHHAQNPYQQPPHLHQHPHAEHHAHEQTHTHTHP